MPSLIVWECVGVGVCESAFLTFGSGSCVLSAAVYTAERLFP
jgi:hypothetical protein